MKRPNRVAPARINYALCARCNNPADTYARGTSLVNVVLNGLCSDCSSLEASGRSTFVTEQPSTFVRQWTFDNAGNVSDSIFDKSDTFDCTQVHVTSRKQAHRIERRERYARK